MAPLQMVDKLVLSRSVTYNEVSSYLWTEVHEKIRKVSSVLRLTVLIPKKEESVKN